MQFRISDEKIFDTLEKQGIDNKIIDPSLYSEMRNEKNQVDISEFAKKFNLNKYQSRVMIDVLKSIQQEFQLSDHKNQLNDTDIKLELFSTEFNAANYDLNVTQQYKDLFNSLVISKLEGKNQWDSQVQINSKMLSNQHSIYLKFKVDQLNSDKSGVVLGLFHKEMKQFDEAMLNSHVVGINLGDENYTYGILTKKEEWKVKEGDYADIEVTREDKQHRIRFYLNNRIVAHTDIKLNVEFGCIDKDFRIGVAMKNLCDRLILEYVDF